MKSTIVQPYVFFGGRCDEALKLYKKAAGAKVKFLMRFNESPDAPPPGMVPPGFEKKVMHASFYIGQSLLMASDGCEAGAKFQGFTLSISVKTKAEAAKIFKGLSAGGTVKMPLTKTFWSPCFGMLTDKFGLEWMVSVPGKMG